MAGASIFFGPFLFSHLWISFLNHPLALQDAQPLPVSATSFTSTYKHAKVLTSPETSNYPATIAPPCLLIPARSTATQSVACRPAASAPDGSTSEMQFSDPPLTYWIKTAVREGVQGLCCDTRHGWIWGTPEKHHLGSPASVAFMFDSPRLCLGLFSPWASSFP